MPVVTLMPTFRGLPTAITGSPTPTESESPSVSGTRVSFGASTLNTATSVEASSPTTSASCLAPLEKRTDTLSAPSPTCWLVTRSPLSSITNPDPPPGPILTDLTSTVTTPGPSRAYTPRTEGPSPQPALTPSPCAGHRPRSAARTDTHGSRVHGHHPRTIPGVHLAHRRPIPPAGIHPFPRRGLLRLVDRQTFRTFL